MNSSILYKQLTEHASVWGYGSLTQEERSFLLNYRKEVVKKNAAPFRKKSRKPRNGKVFVDHRLATWTPSAVDTNYKTVDSYSPSYLAALS